jgi:hypothetical protein
MTKQNLQKQGHRKMPTLNLQKAKTTIKALLHSFEKRVNDEVNSVSDNEEVKKALEDCGLDQDDVVYSFEDDHLDDGGFTIESDCEVFSYGQVNDIIHDFLFESQDKPIDESIDEAKSVEELREILVKLKKESIAEAKHYIDTYEVNVEEADINYARHSELIDLRDSLESITYSMGGQLNRYAESLLEEIEKNLEIFDKVEVFDNDKSTIQAKAVEDIGDMFSYLEKILDNTNDVDINSLSRDDWDLIKLFLANKEKMTSLLQKVEKI